MGRNVTISISDRTAGAVSTSLCPWNRAAKPDCSSIPGHFIPASPSSCVPLESSANDTWRRPQRDGGPEGSNTNVNIV